MKNKYLFFLLGTFLLLVSGCNNSILPAEQVNEKTWTENITQGGIFSPSNNFTLERKVFEYGELVSQGLIKNDNGKIRVTIDEDVDDYYHITGSDSYEYIYFDNDEGWIKQSFNSLASFQVEILDYTIMYPFEYEAFTYDQESKIYYVDNYDSSNYKDPKEQIMQATFDRVEFKFDHDNVVEFTAIKDGNKWSLVAKDYDSTKVELPNAHEIDYSNPYWYTKHGLTNISIEPTPYVNDIAEELNHTELYITGTLLEAEEAQLVIKHSYTDVFVYYGNPSVYSSKTKSFKISFPDGKGMGPDYTPTTQPSNSINVVITDNDISFEFHIYKDQKRETYDVAYASATLTNREDITHGYEYQDASKGLQKKLENKIIEIDAIDPTGEEKGPDLFSGGYLVMSFDVDNTFFEWYLNDNTVILGYPSTTMYDGENFQLTYRGKIDLNTQEISSFTNGDLSGYLGDNNFISVSFGFGSYYYYGTFKLTNTSATPMYGSLMQHRYEVDENVWDNTFNNYSKLTKGTDFAYSRVEDGQTTMMYSVLFVNNKIQYQVTNCDDFSTRNTYYELLGDGKAYRYEFYGSSWYKTMTTITDDDILAMFKMKDVNYKLKDAEFDGFKYVISNFESYSEIDLYFEFNTLNSFEKHHNDGKTVEYGTYFFNTFADIDLPELN